MFPILALQLIKGSSFWAILGFEEEECIFFFYHSFNIYSHDSQWSVTISTNSQTRFNSMIDTEFSENWSSGLRREVKQYHDFEHV